VAERERHLNAREAVSGAVPEREPALAHADPAELDRGRDRGRGRPAEREQEDRAPPDPVRVRGGIGIRARRRGVGFRARGDGVRHQAFASSSKISALVLQRCISSSSLVIASCAWSPAR
jgi:hypothetical protein